MNQDGPLRQEEKDGGEDDLGVMGKLLEAALRNKPGALRRPCPHPPFSPCPTRTELTLGRMGWAWGGATAFLHRSPPLLPTRPGVGKTRPARWAALPGRPGRRHGDAHPTLGQS